MAFSHPWSMKIGGSTTRPSVLDRYGRVGPPRPSDIGVDLGWPVTTAYQSPFAFTGELDGSWWGSLDSHETREGVACHSYFHSKSHARGHRSRPGSSPNHRAVSQSFHLPLHIRSGPHSTDERTDLSSKNGSGGHVLDYREPTHNPLSPAHVQRRARHHSITRPAEAAP
jgi:hypothetical protein